MGELEVPAPHRIPEIAAALAVYQPFEALAVAAFTARARTFDQTAGMAISGIMTVRTAARVFMS
jgi:hypothetical protein